MRSILRYIDSCQYDLAVIRNYFSNHMFGAFSSKRFMLVLIHANQPLRQDSSYIMASANVEIAMVRYTKIAERKERI